MLSDVPEERLIETDAVKNERTILIIGLITSFIDR